MDFQKALNILGLKPDFNEIELKQAWRRLSHKNHPDDPEMYRIKMKKKQQENKQK